MDFYKEDVSKVLKFFHTSEKGLNKVEAEKRIKDYGYNKLETKSKINPFKIFISQFKSFIIYILLFAVVFSLIIGEYVDSIVILIILLLNALIGFFQELNANRSLEALKEITTLNANVMRDGYMHKIDSGYLVPGDIIYLEAGDRIPADARIIEAMRAQVDESALTGESLPTSKFSETLTKNVQIGDKKNMIFSSTNVVAGTIKAVVVKTGMETEIGKITSLIKEAKIEQTPLQRKLNKFGKELGGIVIVICVIVFFASFLKDSLHNGASLSAMMGFMFIAISLAVAAVPTALPAVVTIALSIGVKRLLKRKSLVKNLSSVETLGSCDVICTDKTGTLTRNEMTVRLAWTFDKEAHINGGGYNPTGNISGKLNSMLYKIGAVCNNASLYLENNKWKITGDPTEAALLVSARKAGIKLNMKVTDEIPFDSDRKLMSVLATENGKKFVMMKGAPDKVLSTCKYVLVNGVKNKLTDDMVRIILSHTNLYAGKAMRVLAFAYKEGDLTEDNMIFVGLQAMIDPPRKEVLESIVKAKKAGIRIIMITGDNVLTAKAIAEQVGIKGKALSGNDLSKMTDVELIKALKEGTNIFARVIPEHKQRIVTLLQKLEYTVAMTGDGVNDAPALRKANIGIAVGSGTEVAKEASDFVLLDDGFSHIVNAVEEGRGIYDNIQKSIMLLLSGNVGEVLIIFLAVLLGMNLPLTAVLLLWINLVTDGAPALAYSVDPYGSDIMDRKPKPHRERILPKSKLKLIMFLGLIGTIIALSLFYFVGGDKAGTLVKAQTFVFNFIVLYELILVFVIRQDYKVKFFSNIWMWGAIILSIGLQAILMYTPLNVLFGIVSLSFRELGILAIAGLGFYVLSMAYYHLLHKKSGSESPI